MTLDKNFSRLLGNLKAISPEMADRDGWINVEELVFKMRKVEKIPFPKKTFVSISLFHLEKEGYLEIIWEKNTIIPNPIRFRLKEK